MQHIKELNCITLLTRVKTKTASVTCIAEGGNALMQCFHVVQFDISYVVIHCRKILFCFSNILDFGQNTEVFLLIYSTVYRLYNREPLY